MSELKKVDQSKKAKEQYKHPIIDLLFADEPLTKEEIGEKLHVESERAVRDIVAQCSMHYPIIATSNKKGYRRAKAIDTLEGENLKKEIDEVEHQLNELKSRVTCLKKRMKPLVAWLKVASKNAESD